VPTVPLMRSRHLLPFAAIVERKGPFRDGFLREAYLPMSCLDDPDMLVSIHPAGLFRERAAQRSGWSSVAVSLAEVLDIEDLGDFGLALMSAPTLRKCLLDLRELMPTQSSAVAIVLEPLPGGELLVSHRVLYRPAVGEWHMITYVLTLMLKVVQLAAPTWLPDEVRIAAESSPMRNKAIEALGTAPRFEQPLTGFIVPASMLDQSLLKRPEASLQQSVRLDDLWSTAPATNYQEALRQLILSYAHDGWLSMEDASKLVDTSPRTLQRRLLEEKTTYSHLVEVIRGNMAVELLESSDASMSEIARELGYKHQGDFTRAFRRWVGVSPSTFRRQREA
jgi:AraC-like DNA-binding protein